MAGLQAIPEGTSSLEMGFLLEWVLPRLYSCFRALHWLSANEIRKYEIWEPYQWVPMSPCAEGAF